ncbi:MAG TPA: carbamoyltransferase HypF [Candidatus Baltobacteraceae bacterium]|nr:carbamoyltransferase HypF [Candidatus Baltobacteraceae bacterium]
MRAPPKQARSVRIGGVVQGVGFRPHVYRTALRFHVTGWVRNADDGVEIHAEGDGPVLEQFVREVLEHAPPAARVGSCESHPSRTQQFDSFEIRESVRRKAPTVRVSADLPVCEACLRELFDPDDRRYRYPYINCTDCGPRYSIVTGLPYDRPQTTMRDWIMCAQCRAEYDDPLDRRFHAQPIACPECGPAYVLEERLGRTRGHAAIEAAARLLNAGGIVAVKGLGGYHLACDARNQVAVEALRARKYRKERPFALMVRDAAAADAIVAWDAPSRRLAQSQARPIVLGAARAELPGVAPENGEFGVMLAYTPVHHLLFDAGAPDVLVMTSANRSSEPIAFKDDDARESLSGIADALLAGEREIARRIDDSVARARGSVPLVLRHARGYAPQAVASLPAHKPIVCAGADLKNAIAVVVRGQAFVSQHVGDLEYADAFASFKHTIDDLCALYELPEDDRLVAHDAHPGYSSTAYAQSLAGEKRAIQHHRAHIASVLAEREAFEHEVTGFAFDGTGYGEDGTIWGGEVFTGSLAGGLQRTAHLRPALLPGGDAAARHPVQAAAGFLYGHPAFGDGSIFEREPFAFPARFRAACELVQKNVRVFATTSMGRLFDTAAALLGFTRPIAFEAQAAMWLEYLARESAPVASYPFPFENGVFDFYPLLEAVVNDRVHGRDVREIARAFHGAVADAIVAAAGSFGKERVVVSGGVFQNAVLLNGLERALGERLWTNRSVPPNDGGICLGQAAIVAVSGT